jgi:hypothetical protein
MHRHRIDEHEEARMAEVNTLEEKLAEVLSLAQAAQGRPRRSSRSSTIRRSRSACARCAARPRR